MDKNGLVSQLISLNLPTDQYVVVGGGVLTIHGVRETEDIDLVVTPDLFNKLKLTWTQKIRPNGKLGLYKECFEAYLDVNCGICEKSFQALFENSNLIEGIHFIDLPTLAEFKRSYGREKDLHDLKLIEQLQNRK
ncbi:zinc ABC transporter substrate-binding protein [Acinetobacter dispersus]|uniref:zinc ABC transporter substrate-binding protein n=1 Tax=Acinetobacter dispersus TaxID=70348 RepID=UPI00300A3F5E